MWEFVKTLILIGLFIFMPFLAIYIFNVFLTTDMPYTIKNWFIGFAVCLFTKAVEIEI